MRKGNRTLYNHPAGIDLLPGRQWKRATLPSSFHLPKGGSIKAYCKAEGFYNSMPTQAEIGLFIDKSNWKIVSVSSQDGNEKSSNAIDNKENTIWHSRFGNNEPHYPHEIIVDMAQTYRVSKFIYQARKDGANGRIRAYEVYFSNNPKQWGEPAIRGEFANTSAPQRVNLPIPTDARYFKLIALSSIDRRNWASAAELSIEAINGVKKETKTFKPLLQENAKYRIKHAASGLYLQYLPDQSKKYEGDFCINKNNAQDESFIFTFTPVEGFTSFYTVKVNGKQMIKGEDGWRCSLGEAEGSDGWIQLEQLDDQSMKMKGLWQPTYYINLDAEVENAYIYPNKSEGAIWKLEKVQ